MPNERLADAMRQAGLSHKALARRVQDLSARRGALVRCDHTSVSRWLAGTRPRDATARLIAEVLSESIGRQLSLDDIGLTSSKAIDARLGLDYEAMGNTADHPLVPLWMADLEESRILRESLPDSNAWSNATLKWLLRAEDDDTRIHWEANAGRRIGEGDVKALRHTVEAFSSLDGMFGGGHARAALIQYLRSDMAGMLQGRFSEKVKSDFFTAASEATLLAAWMSYDAGVHGLAQRYFIQALRLSDFADNQLLGGSILDAMSHQATFLGRSADAVNLARAARSGTKAIATPGVIAHFHAMEARALAVGGDAVGAGKALNSAVRVFERREIGDDPDWISYFDDAELSAEFSHCFRDIGRHDDAVTYAQRAVSGSSERSDFFVRMVQAAGHLAVPGSRNSDIDQACAVAAEAVKTGAQIKSARCVKYLADFRLSLAPYAAERSVRIFEESLEGNPLWAMSAS